MKRYIPADRLSQAVRIAIVVEIAVALIAMVSSLLQVQLLMRAQAGLPISETEGSLNDLREMGVSWLAVVVTIVAGVLFLRYLGRASHNAQVMGANDLSASPGWTIGYFFVPVISLWKPYQITQEIWKASAPEAGSWRSQLGSSLVGWWWAFHLLDNFASQIVMRLNLQNAMSEIPDLARLLNVTWLDFGVSLIDLVLCALAFQLIRKLQARQVARYERVGEAHDVVCRSCGESLGAEDAATTTCPVCGAKLDVAPSLV
ncbi:MAG: DUF4328 domain-containing protein [Planctomycetaceae bacterium]